jgi:hypothetical protein
MTAVAYSSVTKDIIKVLWSSLQHDGAAAFKLLEGLPLLLALSAKDLPEEPTQILHICRIRRIECHRSGHDEECAPEHNSNTENCLNWNGELVNANESKFNCEADDEYAPAPCTDIKALESTEQHVVNAAPNVVELIRPT